MIKEHKKLNKVVVVGDIHAGMYSNSYEKFEIVKSFFYDQLIPYLIKLKQEFSNDNLTLIMLGDTFDIKQQISVVIQNSVIGIFEELSSILDTYVLVGNHDMPIASNPNINSIRILNHIENIQVVSDENGLSLVDLKDRNHYLFPYNNSAEKEKNIIDSLADGSILYMHTEIAGFHYEGVPVDASKHNQISDFNKFKQIISGHIHKKQEILNILFTGTPYHIRKGEDGNEPGYWLFDFSKDEIEREYIENKVSPRYIKLDYEFFRDSDESDIIPIIENNYVDIKTPYTLTAPIEKVALIEKYGNKCKTLEFTARKPTDLKLENIIGSNGIELDNFSISSTISEFFKDNNSFKSGKNSYILDEKTKRELEEKILESYNKHKYNE